MIKRVSVVTILVRNQEEAIQFYTGKLGFQIQTDMQLEGKRWLSVTPQPGAGPEMVLFDPRTWLPPEAAEVMLGLIGKEPGLVLEADDCRATIADLAAKGVKILREPMDLPYGVEAVFADPFGNAFVLVQPAKQ